MGITKGETKKARTAKELVNADDIGILNLRMYRNAKGTDIVVNGFANNLGDNTPMVIFCTPRDGKIFTTSLEDFKNKFELVGKA